MRPASDDGTALFRGDGLYRLSLDKPIPVAGFWSFTMYEATADGQFFFTQNPLGRYAIGDRTAGLVRKPNGSVHTTWTPRPEYHQFGGMPIWRSSDASPRLSRTPGTINPAITA